MRLLTAGSLVRVQLGEPRRSKVRFAPFFFAEKHPPASLLLLFRKRSRQAARLVCKHTRCRFVAYQPFASKRLAAQMHLNHSALPRRSKVRFAPFFLYRKTFARFLAPPFPQKVTLGSPICLQTRSRRLSVAANFLRLRLRRLNICFVNSKHNITQQIVFLLGDVFIYFCG